MDPVNGQLLDRKSYLEQKIKNQLVKTGKNLEEHAESLQQLLLLIPSTHVEHLITKLEELEGNDVEKVYTEDKADLQTPQEVIEATKIRDEIAQGNVDQALTLVKALNPQQK